RMWGALVGAPSRRGGGRRLPLQLLPEEGRLLAELGVARLEPEPETGRPDVGAKRPRSRGPEGGAEGLEIHGPEVGTEGPDVESKKPKLCRTAAGAEGVETEGPDVDNEGQEADSEEPEVRPEGLEEERPEVLSKGPETGSSVGMGLRGFYGAQVCGVCGRGSPKPRPSPSPPPPAHRERRFRVYRDLWGRGLHLTAGGKFGGDFLVYPGPPPLFHAAAVALCPRSSAPLPLGALLSAARLGTAARKSLLLCAAPPGGAPEYSALRWRRDLG
uniref:tRNA-intron lyase n=1 Tax=Pavo cristatus TaxID=9049 RepID=A0A8C9FS34_PAVCR